MQTGSNADAPFMVWFRNPDWLLWQPKQLYLLTPLGRFTSFWQHMVDWDPAYSDSKDPEVYGAILDELWLKLSPNERYQLESSIAQELELPRIPAKKLKR